MIKWYSKISTKIICILIITFLVISITLGLFSFLAEKKIAFDQMNTQGNQACYRIKAGLEAYLEINQIRPLEKLIDIELESNSQLTGAILQDKESRIIINRKKNAQHKIIESRESLQSWQADPDIYAVQGEIGSDQKTATLFLFFSNKPLTNRLFLFVCRNVILTLILSLTIGIILYLSLRRMIIKPLNVLNNVVEMVISREFDTMAPVMSEDEIGILADSFNHMTVKLRSTIIQIREMNENLEQLVQGRTEALDNANQQLTQANQKMKRDLHMAKKVQMSIIPQVFPTLEMLDVYGAYVPMDDIGGDFYDVFQISDTKVAFVITDVSGHGIPSALITSMAKVSFANNSRNNRLTGEILKSVNDELYANLGESGYYLTVFYCIIDKTTRKIEYSSAGHPDIFILRENEPPLALEANSVFLGFFDDAQFFTAYQYLQKGDRIVLYTDGLTEAKNNEGAFYEKTFYRSLQAQHSLSPRKYVETQIEAVKNFCGENTIYKDDITLLIIDFVMDDHEVHIGMNTQYEYIDSTGVTNPSKLNFINLNNTFVIALEKIENGDYDRALKLLLQLENSFYKRQDNFNVLKLLGFTCYKLERYTEAIAFWEKAISLNPYAEELVVNLGRLWEKIGHHTPG